MSPPRAARRTSTIRSTRVEHQRSSSSRPATRRRTIAGIAFVSVSLLAAGGLLLGQASAAMSVETSGSDIAGRVILSADSSPSDLLELGPGDPAHWEVTARLEDAAEATVALELRRSGEIIEVPRGLRVTVASCGEEWTQAGAAPTCEPGEDRVALTPPRAGKAGATPVFDIAADAPGAPAHLLVTLAIDPSTGRAAAERLADLGDQLALGLTPVAVDGVPVARARDRAVTDGLLPLLAAAAIAAGVVGLSSAIRLARSGTAEAKRPRTPRPPGR